MMFPCPGDYIWSPFNEYGLLLVVQFSGVRKRFSLKDPTDPNSNLACYYYVWSMKTREKFEILFSVEGDDNWSIIRKETLDLMAECQNVPTASR